MTKQLNNDTYDSDWCEGCTGMDIHNFYMPTYGYGGAMHSTSTMKWFGFNSNSHPKEGSQIIHGGEETIMDSDNWKFNEHTGFEIIFSKKLIQKLWIKQLNL